MINMYYNELVYVLDVSRSCATATTNKVHKSIFCKTLQFLIRMGLIKYCAKLQLFPGSPVFLPPQKPTLLLPISISTKTVDEKPPSGSAIAKSHLLISTINYLL